MEDLASRPAELDERARAMRWWYDGTMARVAANVEATLQAVAANTPRVPSYTLLLSHFARDPRGPTSTARYAEIEGAIRSNLLGRDLAEVWVLYEQRPTAVRSSADGSRRTRRGGNGCRSWPRWAARPSSHALIGSPHSCAISISLRTPRSSPMATSLARDSDEK
jgi:hypothetical protein